MVPSIKIIYEDSDLLVIDKPPGIVVDTLEARLKEQGNNLERAGIVHRLDKDTSGVLLVAKTQKALENLQAQFKQRLIKKEYLALVHGFINEPGKVEGNIGRNPGNREKFIVIDSRLRGNDMVNHGKEAETEYEPVENFQLSVDRLQEIFSDLTKPVLKRLLTTHYLLLTLLSCKPRTGRTHQIRVHLKYIGHPIVSDEKYVGRKMNRLDKVWCPRMFLHAKKIDFKHPASGKWIEIESELSEDLKNTLSLLTELDT